MVGWVQARPCGEWLALPYWGVWSIKAANPPRKLSVEDSSEHTHIMNKHWSGWLPGPGWQRIGPSPVWLLQCPWRGPLKPQSSPSPGPHFKPHHTHCSCLVSSLVCTNTPHLSTGSLTTTVTMTTSHLFLSSATQAPKHKPGGGEKRRRGKHTHLHTHTDKHGMEIFLWCWCKETGTLKPSHPPHEMALCSWSLIRGEAGCTPPTQSHEVINHGPNQGQSIYTASTLSDLFITRLQLFRLVTR